MVPTATPGIERGQRNPVAALLDGQHRRSPHRLPDLDRVVQRGNHREWARQRRQGQQCVPQLHEPAKSHSCSQSIESRLRAQAAFHHAISDADEGSAFPRPVDVPHLLRVGSTRPARGRCR
eukprot:scaffold13434_cov72-Phaeocystis_antarctica.AAC.2